MMPQALERRIKAELDLYPTSMRRVAAYVLDQPADVALLSMREQARRAGVLPASMTRFAQRLGYSGYDQFRELFVASMRGRISDFGIRAEELSARRRRFGASPLAEHLADAILDLTRSLAEPRQLAAVVDAAALIGAAGRIFCLGHRACYAPAFHFSYVAGLYGLSTSLLDSPGGIGADSLSEAVAGDVMFAVSFAPYTKATVELTLHARDLGVEIVALSDSVASPLARVARCAITVPADLAEAPHMTTPAFMAAELLAAVVVAGSGAPGRALLERNEAEFARRGIYWNPAVEASS